MNMNRGDREKQDRLQLEAAALMYRPTDIIVLECLEEATVNVGLAGVPVRVLREIIARKYPYRQVHNNRIEDTEAPRRRKDDNQIKKRQTNHSWLHREGTGGI